MTSSEVGRDERTVAVENAGYRLAYLMLSFALLADIAYRSFVHGEQSWDLVALVLLGGGVNAAYQAMHRVLNRRWVVLTARAALSAAAVAAILALVVAKLKR